VLLSFWRWITSWTVVVARTWSELATSVAGAPTEVISPALSLQLSYLRRRRLVYTKSPPSIDIRDRRPRRRPPPLLSATSWTQMYYSSARCVPRGAPAQDVTSIIVPRPSARAPSPPDHTPRSQTIDKCAHVNCRQLQPSTTGWPQKSTEWQRNVVKTVEQHFWTNFSGYVGHATVLTTAYSLSVGLWLGLELGLDFDSGWLVVMHTYLYYFPLSLSLSRNEQLWIAFIRRWNDRSTRTIAKHKKEGKKWGNKKINHSVRIDIA